MIFSYKNGACVLDESVSDICSIDIFDTDKIIFIENKTNYTEYCLNRQTDRELVVYHGGFTVPSMANSSASFAMAKISPHIYGVTLIMADSECLCV